MISTKNFFRGVVWAIVLVMLGCLLAAIFVASCVREKRVSSSGVAAGVCSQVQSARRFPPHNGRGFPMFSRVSNTTAAFRSTLPASCQFTSHPMKRPGAASLVRKSGAAACRDQAQEAGANIFPT
jgi:hypothetical protein